MLKLHRCNLCKIKFKPDKINRLQIIKKTKYGKKEYWICNNCYPVVRDKLKEIYLYL